MNNAQKIERWATYLKQIRRFLDDRGFLEITTPCLVQAGAFESTLDTLKVSWNGGQGELHTSPEIEMKKQMAILQSAVYQIAPCFRDDPMTEVHQREFSMLEFYRVQSDYHAIRADMRALLKNLSDGRIEIEEVSFSECMRRHAGVDIEKYGTADLLRPVMPIETSPSDTWDDMLFKLLIEKIEPGLNPRIATLVYDYPASMAALAAIGPSGFAERFEIYWQGMELCNGATELVDGEEIRRRYEKESQRRVQEGKAPHPVPESLFEALALGLPPCAGVAVGLGRLFRALHTIGVGAGAR